MRWEVEMERITVKCGPNAISLEDVDKFDVINADRTLQVYDSGNVVKYQPNTSVLITAEGTTQTSLLVLAYDAPSRIHEHSAACARNTLVAIVGSFTICLTPDLQTVLWQRRCDIASCLGIYALPGEQELIVHGELTITKLTVDGEIVWQTAGRDTFTGPFSLTSTAAFATDFYGTRYMIGLPEGNIIVMPPDK
jgi:hypothetical protein